MARTEISKTTVSESAGLELVGATYETLSTGDGNGVEVPYGAGDFIVLYNDTAGAAVFTIKVPLPESLNDIGSTVTDVTVNVAVDELFVFPESSVFRQTDGNIYVDCDIAGKVLALAAPG